MMRVRWILLIGALLFMTACTVPVATPGSQQTKQQQIAVAAPAPIATTPANAFQWESDPAASGLDIKALAAHEALCKETGADACLVVYKGKIVQDYRSERYSEPFWAMSAGEPVMAYATRSLFKPLGMGQTRLAKDASGNSVTYADMVTTPRDFARIGLLMLARGSWQGKQVVSSEWLTEATRPVPSLQADESMRYGYLWWVAPHAQVSYDGYLPRAFDLFARFVPTTAAAAKS